MSTGSSNGASRAEVVVTSAVFVLLLVLAVSWPLPVLYLNEQTVDAPLRISEKSFLGREVPSWDVPYWCLVGLYVLALFHGRVQRFNAGYGDLRGIVKRIPHAFRVQVRAVKPSWFIGGFVALIAAIVLIWATIDVPVIGYGELIQSDSSRSFVRYTNRLGGGMNPLMVVVFFVVAGMLLSKRDWTRVGVAMALAAATGGVLAHFFKYLVGRSRPELWLGPLHNTWPSATSFPSGHTVGAFSIAGAIVFGTRSTLLRIVALATAASVAASRVLAFRHWPSDVFTSTVLGLFVGWFYTQVVRRAAEEDKPDEFTSSVA